jgi:hypothetical protein
MRGVQIKKPPIRQWPVGGFFGVTRSNAARAIQRSDP